MPHIGRAHVCFIDDGCDAIWQWSPVVKEADERLEPGTVQND